MSDLFFDGLEGIGRVALAGLVTYTSVVVFVRLMGKRSTSQMNNFDWIVTVAIGSIVGSTIISSSVPILEGLTAVGVLFLAQLVVTKISVFWPSFSSFVHAEPAILFFRGKFVESAMRDERVTRQEIVGAIREAGIYRFEDVGAVVLESDAKLSVLSAADDDDPRDDPTLQCIGNYEQAVRSSQSESAAPGAGD